MGGGGGGSNEVKETQAQKEAARVAAKQWDLYQNDFKQFEDNFIERVDSFNSNENMADTKQSAELGYSRDYGDVREQSAQVLSSSGVVPTSGKFQAQMAELSTDQATSQGDTVNRAQASEQDKYVAGLSDVAAIGMGQKADALEGMGDVANTSLSKATADAEADFNKRSSNLQLAGGVAGAGLRSYQVQKTPDFVDADKAVDGVSTNTTRMNKYNHSPGLNDYNQASGVTGYDPVVNPYSRALS